MKYAGSGVTGKEARDACRARRRAFIRSGRRVEPAPRRSGASAQRRANAARSRGCACDDADGAGRLPSLHELSIHQLA